MGKVEAQDWPRSRKERVLTSLMVAYQTTEEIDPELCVEFLQLWSLDLDIWHESLTSYPVLGNVYEALSHLDWPGVIMSDHQWLVSGVEGVAAEEEVS